ncbi:hypothetical protein FS749_000594 [Ceratobasidium sp. UAMH 11750]|nr:hypothetical protein FS749_000594 [Ceratobasidium sp. UAMH 11750]
MSTTSLTRFAVNNYVYMTGADGRAVKGQIQSIKRDTQGRTKPGVNWNGQKDTVTVPFTSLKKDNTPVQVPASPAPNFVQVTPAPVPKNNGPVPMDLDLAGHTRVPLICHKCGGRGHMIKDCPSKEVSGYGAQVEEIVSEEEEEKENA